MRTVTLFIVSVLALAGCRPSPVPPPPPAVSATPTPSAAEREAREILMRLEVDGLQASHRILGRRWIDPLDVPLRVRRWKIYRAEDGPTPGTGRAFGVMEVPTTQGTWNTVAFKLVFDATDVRLTVT